MPSSGETRPQSGATRWKRRTPGALGWRCPCGAPLASLLALSLVTALACTSPTGAAATRATAKRSAGDDAFRPLHTYEHAPAKSSDGLFSIEFSGVAHQLEPSALGIEDADLAFLLMDPEIAMAVYRFGRPDLDLDDAVHLRRAFVEEEGKIDFLSERRTFLPGSHYRVASISRFVDRTKGTVWYCSVVARGPSDVYEVIAWSEEAESGDAVCDAAFGLRLAPE